MIYCKSRTIKLLFFLLTFSFFSQSLVAQPKEWGEIPLQTLKEDIYHLDSSPSAVVLFEKGHLRIENDLQYYLDRHVRIKIIRPEGYKYATIELDYNKGYDQDIEDLEAVTYRLNKKGKIEEYKVEKNSFFDEKVIDDWNHIRFTFPSLEPGCIIEYRYTHKIGDPGYLPVWYFDRTIPVEWNQLVAEFPSFLNFSKILSGEKELDINEWKEFNKTIRMTPGSNEKNLYGNTSRERRSRRINFNGERFTWVMKNREAIPDLPFMTTPDDYRTQIRFQLSELNIPDKQIQEDYFKSWTNVITRLLEQDEFGSYLLHQAQYKDIISTLSIGNTLKIKRVSLIYDYIIDSFNWDNTYNLYGEDRFDQVITSRSGSGSELNLLLTGLLRQAGVEAYPVLISTRNHGSVLTKYVLPNQFNHLIVLVKLEDHDLLLDAGIDNPRPLYLLPENDLNGKGLVLKRPESGKEEWASLIPLQQTIRAASLHAEINPDGSINGKISGVSTGYFALQDRNSIQEKGEKAFLSESLFQHFSNYNISGSNLINLADLDSTLNYDVHLNSGLAAHSQVVNNTIYLDAVPIMKWVENPLKQKVRKFPINFPYSYGQQLIIVYKIPDGYKVEEYPDRLVSRIPKDGGMFSRTVEMQDRQIIIRFFLDLGRSSYSADEYDRLKLFFDQIVEAHSEKIVLKKAS